MRLSTVRKPCDILKVEMTVQKFLAVFFLKASLEVTELQIAPEQIVQNLALDNKLKILWDLLVEL